MTNEMIKILNEMEFEGNDLTIVEYRGQMCWIAREVGVAIGYGNSGQRFASNMTGDWRDEFTEGKDYLKLVGSELVEFKGLLEPTPFSGVGRSSHLLLLTEAGINLALVLTKKKAGKKLRRFLADAVLPQITRDGAYLPERTVENNQLATRQPSSGEISAMCSTIMVQSNALMAYIENSNKKLKNEEIEREKNRIADEREARLRKREARLQKAADERETNKTKVEPPAKGKECWKCKGTGVIERFKGRDGGKCYGCNGTGLI